MNTTTETNKSRPPLPPFTAESAAQKVQAAEDAWNSRDPERVSMAYTLDTVWRNRSTFLNGRDAVQAFLEGKWDRELDYRLKKTLWSFTDNRISVKFEYEYHSEDGQWYRAYGNEQWEFNADGLITRRDANVNDILISAVERRIRR